ncbi:MAG: hypothetical protein NZ480_00700, partial [Bdellovibrionaceae bacterium]|nr:hypothetical protein [Pseudobdellovibrionaceae bacterium]
PLLDVERFLDAALESRTPTILAGFVRLSRRAINNIKRATGIPFDLFFDPEVMACRGDKHFSDKEIAMYYRRLYRECHRRGLRFTTCYIGNGIKDYFQYQQLWSNPQDCCDVVTQLNSFQITAQSVPWTERAKHAPCLDFVTQSLRLEAQWKQSWNDVVYANRGNYVNYEDTRP